MTSGGPRIGIIADTTLQGHLLSSAVRGQGYDVVVNSDPGNIELSWLTSDALDLWVVDLNHEDRWQDFLDRLLEDTPVPILFSDGQAPARNSPLYPRWERRLLSKMLDYVGRPKVEVKLEGKVVHTANLVALQSVEEAGLLRRIWDSVRLFFFALFN